MNSNSNFFERSNYFVGQNAICSKSYDKYQIFNNKKENIGFVRERMTKGKKILRQVVGKTFLPAQIEIRSANGTLEVLLSRRSFFQSNKIVICDPRGNVLGCIKRRVNFFKSTYTILNQFDEIIAEISGNDKEWSFMITDASKSKIGSIDKKWEGIMKEIYSSADKFNVNIKTDFVNKNDKIAIFSSAIVMYMI
ncbi:phospholipid scramblase-related protein [Flavobacterium sp. MC2016-06]|jgi:uncharacterized protein YxjI|uniref:phospholipid scramblase-related protein n=1 Tax=Flavobacterium sp. MC2016-06 TaxID=2676308 RepID=UPI0012BB1945|nr:phospholipid scramblase-related protein [Flavobacterium sp. MC2016-06]MBU3859671.1 scramblase [Flavobacterium sp. MC2016-06]